MRFTWLLLVVAACCAQEKPDFSVSVDLVPITCSITDKSGQPVRDMRIEEFVVTDNGKAQPVRYLWREEDLPLTVGLVVDTSGSQMRFVQEHRKTMARFLETVLRPTDRAFVVSVDSSVRLVRDTTSSLDALRQGITELDPRLIRFREELGEPCQETRTFVTRNGIRFTIPSCGGTLLWNGVYASSRLKMKPEMGRKALLLLTDGLDNANDRQHSLKDAIEAAQGADASVYTIRYKSSLAGSAPVLFKVIDGRMQAKAMRNLRKLAEETGGRAYDSQVKETGEIFEEIERDLRTQYVLAFAPPADARDGKFHKVEIRSKRSGVVIRAREGYKAEAKQEPR